MFPKVVQFLKQQTSDSQNIASLYSLADHSKCLAFMLGDGIVPSNVRAGYLARLIIRRALRFLEHLNLHIPLSELVLMHLNSLKEDFPSLKHAQGQIQEILDIETKRFSETLTKGQGIISRFVKEKKTIDDVTLITLYDTHGMPPDIAQRIAQDEGINVVIPKNFDSMIAELHSHEETEKEQQVEESSLPETKRLYYDDHYRKEFDAKVTWVQQGKQGSEVILDKTVFYPEGGGQPGDIGFLQNNGQQIKVAQVIKKDDAIIHILDGSVQVGDTVHGCIDWDHRYTLMKHHTGTHVVNGALRQLFGEHIWQAGSQLGLSEARFDFSHYKPISDQEKKEIETMANRLIKKMVPVEKKIMQRNDAEKAYGFRLYQGGVPPCDSIRVIHIPGVDVEACGGTHLNNIKEVEKIRIIRTERIQDGVNRVVFAAGAMAEEHEKAEDRRYHQIISLLEPRYTIQHHAVVADQLHRATEIFSVSSDQLEKTIQRFLHETDGMKKKTSVYDLNEACTHLFSMWKKTQKKKKQVSTDEIQRLRKQGELVFGTSITVIAAETTYESTATAGALVTEPDYVVHIYDGTKITSMVSDNVALDLRDIAPALGKILGGSGGGKPRMTQSGGPKQDNAHEALETAKQLTKKKLTKK